MENRALKAPEQSRVLEPFEELKKLVRRMAGIHLQLAQSTPQMQRGLVWCCKCGRKQPVDSAKCLATGWPKCCGETMTLDSPAERKAMEENS